MEQIKSYTDLEQSKKLEKILPLESADMHYSLDIDIMEHENIPTITEENDHFELFQSDIPCWSLAALLNAIPIWYDIHPTKCGVAIKCDYGKEVVVISDNYVDACVEMILKLNELNLL